MRKSKGEKLGDRVGNKWGTKWETKWGTKRGTKWERRWWTTGDGDGGLRGTELGDGKPLEQGDLRWLYVL